MKQLLKKVYHNLFSLRTRLDITHFLFKIRSIKYRENLYRCNCCNRSFSKFLYYGNPPRKNAECPYCHSLERTRLLLFFLKNETLIFKEQLRVLHFAPEYQLQKILKKQSILYLSVDIDPELAMQKEDITNLSFKDNLYDMILCSHELMHVPDEKKALNELFRVLKPGGTALIQTQTNLPWERTLELSDRDFPQGPQFRFCGNDPIFRLHGKDFGERLKQCGFEVTETEYALNLREETRTKYCLGEKEKIFVCYNPV